MSLDSKKGTGIKFVGGKYVGCPGWLNKMKDATKEFVHVIAHSKEGAAHEEVKTRVKHENYVLVAEVSASSNYKESTMIS